MVVGQLGRLDGLIADRRGPDVLSLDSPTVTMGAVARLPPRRAPDPVRGIPLMAKKLQRKVPVRRTTPTAGAASATASGTARGSSLFGARVTPRVLSEFTSQLSVLQDAGIPVTRSLRILEGQMPQGAMKRTAASLVEDVEGGTSLSEAMAKHPKVFDDLYVNMVRAGEAGGIQEEILNRLSSFMEASEEIKSKIKGALAYPITILIVMVTVLIVVFAFVIPDLIKVFEKLIPGGRDAMDWTTLTVMGVSDHLQAWWWAWLLGIGFMIGLHMTLVVRVPGYRRFRDVVLLRIPFVGRLVRKSQVARFSRTFGTLVQSGVPHLDALKIVGDSSGNVLMREAVADVHASIREGGGIAAPMGESGMFDDIVVNMVDVGEQTGELDRMLNKVADRYEVEVDRTVNALFKVIEPVLLVVMAVVVGFVVFALFSPLVKLMEGLNR